MNLWIFDNDGTLYDDSGIRDNFPMIFSEYFSNIVGIKKCEVPSKIIELKSKWNTELSVLAMVKEYNVDFDLAVENTYLKLDFDKCKIIKDDTIFNTLTAIKDTKIVFTNSPSIFAKKILLHSGLIGFFSSFFGIQESNFIEKPNLNAYTSIQNHFSNYEKIIFCDNSLVNLEVAKSLGWITIWYRQNKESFDKEVNKKHIIIDSFDELLSLQEKLLKF